MSESAEIRRKRLVHRSRYRGVKESDLLFGQFADAPSAALDDAPARPLRGAARRDRPGPAGLGLRPRAGAAPARQRRVRACCARFEPDGVTALRRATLADARRREAERRGPAGPAPSLLANAPEGLEAAVPRRAAAPRPGRRPSCTSPATGRASRFSAGMVALLRARGRDRRASRPGTACPTTGSRPTPGSWPSGCARWRGWRPGPGAQAAPGPHHGQRHGAEGAAARAWCAPAHSARRGRRRASTATRCSPVSSATATAAPAPWSRPATTPCAAAWSTSSRAAASSRVRLDFFGSTAGVDPRLRSADPALAGQGRRRSS